MLYIVFITEGWKMHFIYRKNIDREKENKTTLTLVSFVLLFYVEFDNLDNVFEFE
jgi:hypothetical protein